MISVCVKTDLFFEVEVLASLVKPDLSSYGYVPPRQAHCETAQLHCGRLIARPHVLNTPYLLFTLVAADDKAPIVDLGFHCVLFSAPERRTLGLSVPARRAAGRPVGVPGFRS